MQNLRGIIGKVKEERDTFQTAVLFKITSEETSCFQVDTHGTEHNREVVLMTIVCALICHTLLLNQASLSTNLRGNFVVRKASSGEDGDLLSTGDGVHGVDGGDTGRDHLLGVDLTFLSVFVVATLKKAPHSGVWVDRTAVDV